MGPADGIAPVAVVATPRVRHRADLLRNLSAFIPKEQCFVLESGPDLDNPEVAVNDAFFHAATGIAVEDARKEYKNLRRAYFAGSLSAAEAGEQILARGQSSDKAQQAMSQYDSKVALYDPPVLEFLHERSYVTKLTETFRLGKAAVDFINDLFLNTLRKVFEECRTHLNVTRELTNIHLLTPESATGHTVTKAHVLALQQRRPDETQPDGQQLELGRRFVAFTRAMRHLWIWVQALDVAEDPWTRRLQEKAQAERVNFWNLHETWRHLGVTELFELQDSSRVIFHA
eukprot:s2156_g1.t1